ncbi:MAG: UDP-N-acetylmuramate dehydrogenase [Bacteroidales bacterium]|nr:UDP-N-acetylmuramate dehydrogenase [Bacteroidales bacterium]
MILKNISLGSYNTFGLNYITEFFVSVKTEGEAIKIFKSAGTIRQPLLILGGGSNMLFTGDYRGTIIHPEIKSIVIEEKNDEYVVISAGAGEEWDEFVGWTVDNGFGGLENLSLIPGTVGAAPVQNIGAYGVEVKDTIVKVRAVSTENGSIREFDKNDCIFGYRSSIFKTEMKGKYLVTRVFFKLAISPALNLIYGSLADEVSKLGGADLKNVRAAVIKIRKSKLPDPEIIGNAGSFFKNPVVDFSTAEALRKKYPQMPCYEDPSGGIKLAAGWLIDQCGWKGKVSGSAGVHDKQALVIVNCGGASGTEILNLAEEIRKSVWYRFEVELENEVEVISSI